MKRKSFGILPWIAIALAVANLGWWFLADIVAPPPTISSPPEAVHPDALVVLDDKKFAELSRPPSCYRWGPFATARIGEASALLGLMGLTYNQETQPEATKASPAWIYVPPLISRVAAMAKLGELRTLGVTDAFIVNDRGPWQNAISLGVFSTDEAGRRYLAQLQAKGVRSAILGHKGEVKQTQEELVIRMPLTDENRAALASAYPEARLALCADKADEPAAGRQP